MEYVTFSNAKKIEYFDKIAELFYNKNFGQMSKSDIELMMFDFYLETMIDDNKNSDGTIDYNFCSDYKISKDLGITQQRVRNLKVRNQLVNPIDFKWENAFAKLVDNARYDSETHKVTMNIPDPNLFYEIENFLDEHGAYIDKQINSKVLKLRAEYFVDIVLAIESESTRKTIIKELKKTFKESNKEETKFNENNIGKTLIDDAVNLTGVLNQVLSLLPSGSASFTILCSLIKAVSNTYST